MEVVMARAAGFRYSYGSSHSGPGVPIPDKPGWRTLGPADYYFICTAGDLSDKRGEHFATKEAAEARVKELNDADALASIKVPRTHRKRFDRYRELLGDYWGWSSYSAVYGERHPLMGLPRKPGRYAVDEWYGDDSSWETYETMAEVEERVLTGSVGRIVDLDTGDDIPFALSAHFGEDAEALSAQRT
jgi:hypothetical protein